ncbi:hypothetical protein DF186_20550, partial [Enterococcus hirae]
WDRSVVFSLKFGFFVVVLISVIVLFLMKGRKLFCWVWLKWWILFMKSKVFLLCWLWFFVVVNIFLRLVILENMVEMGLNCMLM